MSRSFTPELLTGDTMPQVLTPELLTYDLKAASDPQVSPDGSRVVYGLSRTDRETHQGESHLWLCDIDGANARQLTWSGTQNRGARWSPRGQHLAFVSNRHQDKGTGLFIMPVDGGEARQILHHAQAIGGLAWSPDGTTLAYTTAFDPDNPDEAERPDNAPPVRVVRRIDYKQDNRGFLNDVRTQVFAVDVASGARRMVTHEPVDHDFPQWSPDGRYLAVRMPNRNGMCSRLGIVSITTGATKLVGPDRGVVSVYAWAQDGQTVLFAGDTQPTAQTDFFRYDVASGEIRRLTDDLHCLPEGGFPTVSGPAQPVWLDERRALFHALRAGASGLHTVDVEAGTVETVQTWPATHTGLSVDRAGRWIVQSMSSLEATGEITVFDLDSGQSRVITAHNAGLLTEHPPAEWERLETTRGDLSIEGWLLKPPGFDLAQRYPVILDVHGGPHGAYGHGFNATQQILASHGFLVLFSNPRGSSTYGRHFAQQVIADWGGEDYLDLMALLDVTLERPYADPERTGIYGYSYGGYMTAWAITQTDRFRAAVCGAPVFDMESFYGTSDIGHTFGELQWGGAPHERRAWCEDRSPATFADRAKTPTLIIHGEADDRCPIGQGEQMFVALKKAGCDVEFVRYPGGSHLMLRSGPPAHREDYYRRVLEWFQRHLG